MRYLVLVTMLFVSTLSFSDDLSSVDLKTVSNHIEKQATELKAGEFTKARKYFYGQVAGDIRDDTLVIYTLEGIGGGGNNYSFFMAVFKRTDNGLEFVDDEIVGGKVTRSATFDTIEDGIIILNTKFQWKDDPNCCHSGIGKAYYQVYGSNMMELNVAPKPITIR